MSLDALEPEALLGPADAAGPFNWLGEKELFHPTKPGSKQPPHVPTFRVETCGLNRCPKTSFRRSTTIG